MFGWLKKQKDTHDNSTKSWRSSLGLFEGTSLSGLSGHSAMNHSHRRPFDATQAVAQFGSWSYAAAMLNAQAVASVPLRLYVRKRVGRKLFNTRPIDGQRARYLAGDQRDNIRPSAVISQKVADWRSEFEEVTEAHPALTALNGRASHHTGLELSVLRMLYLQITGNAFIHPVMDRSLNLPAELCVMPSQWVTVKPGKQQLIDGYEYGSRPMERQRFSADQVIHWKLPSLSNPWYGQGCVEACWSALGLHDAKREMDAARFANHARPDFLLVVKQGASTEALDRFEKQVDAKLRGVRQSGKFITISGDVQATPLNFPSNSVGDEKRVLEEIAACFGVPISKLLANDPNKAGAQTADTAWMRDTILPYCRMDEEKLNEAYLPLFGIEDDAFLAYDNPVPEDRKQAMARRVAYVKAGIMTRNEARAEEGLSPVEGGDGLAE